MNFDRASTLVALLFTAALPAAAFAQNASTTGTLELYPTFSAIGARLAYTGDTDLDAVAHLEWRPSGQTTWRRGVDLARIANQRWAGSVMWLPEDAPVEVRAVIEDPDGGSSAIASTRTRSAPSTVPTGATRWVAPGGNDANAGTFGAPLATLQAAADRSNPGDEIRVRAGIYHQTVRCTRAGTPAQLIHLVAHEPGVVIDGSDPALMQRSDWRSDGGGIWSIPFTGTTRLVCADSLQRLYRHASLADMQANAHGMTQGWTIAGGRLSVKLEDLSSPAGHTMHVARYNVGVSLEAAYLRVSGLEVRYYGTALSPGPAGIALYATGCVVSDNHCHTIGGDGILLRQGASNALIERNLCRDPRIGGWPWVACKNHEEEIQAISMKASGRGNTVRDNTCSGTFDGIDVSWDLVDENMGADLDICDNWITNTCDDGLEPETIAGINTRLLHNRLDNVFQGCSIAPNYQGPTYVLYNTITNYRHSAFKFSNESTGQNWICHNTATTAVAGTAAVWGSGPYSNNHFRNNILIGNLERCVDDDAGESLTGNDFDGDLLYAPGFSTLFRWKGVNYASLSALRTGTGFETNGRAGDPIFLAPADGDYGVQAGSPAIDAGLLLPGINDLYTGAGPDMGAGECSTSRGDATTPVLLSFASAEVGADFVRLTWFASGSGNAMATVYRSPVGGEWTRIGEVAVDGTGYLRYTDPIDVTASRVGYRLGIVEAGIESFQGETWVDLPARGAELAFALEPVHPNPSLGGALTVRFTLPSVAPVSLELLDVTGRRIARREVGLPIAGRPTELDLGAGQRLAPGLYLVRLRQGANTRVSRVAVLR